MWHSKTHAQQQRTKCVVSVLKIALQNKKKRTTDWIVFIDANHVVWCVVVVNGSVVMTLFFGAGQESCLEDLLLVVEVY